MILAAKTAFLATPSLSEPSLEEPPLSRWGPFAQTGLFGVETSSSDGFHEPEAYRVHSTSDYGRA